MDKEASRGRCQTRILEQSSGKPSIWDSSSTNCSINVLTCIINKHGINLTSISGMYSAMCVCVREKAHLYDFFDFVKLPNRFQHWATPSLGVPQYCTIKGKPRDRRMESPKSSVPISCVPSGYLACIANRSYHRGFTLAIC